MPQHQNFADIESEFRAIVDRIVWCTVATVDRAGRPRARILHPVWQGSTGWIATSPLSLKAKHLAANPWVSLTYWDQQHERVELECLAEWDNSIESKRALWELFKSTPEPVGYDPAMIWPSPEDDSFGALKLTPTRISVMRGITSEGDVWRQAIE